MLEEHLFDTSLEAVKASLAIDCSMQRQQQSLMDQALFGSIKPEKKLRICIIFFKEATL
jgi:hypothetical protein